MKTFKRIPMRYLVVILALLSLGATYTARNMLEIGPTATITAVRPALRFLDTNPRQADWEMEANTDLANSFFEISIDGSPTGEGAFKIDEDYNEDALTLTNSGVVINGEESSVDAFEFELEIFGVDSTDASAAVRLTPQPGRDSGSLVVSLGSTFSFMSFRSQAFTNLGSLPLAVSLGAPNFALLVDEFGDVGVGAGFQPDGSLHVFRENGTASLIVEESTSETGIRNLATLINNGPSRLQMQNTDTGRTWSMVADFNNSFQIRQNGPDTANFAIREDGTFSFNNLGGSVMALQPDGNLRIGGVLTEGSDRNSKENIEAVNSTDVLEKVIDLPVSKWNYIADESDASHLGPMAQDFHAAFGLGNSEKHIATLDTGGVALAAIKGLNEKLESENEELLDRIERLEKMVEALSAQ